MYKMARTVSFSPACCVIWKMENVLGAETLESDTFSFDGSQWKLELEWGSSDSIKVLIVSLRKLNADNSHHEFYAHSFIVDEERTYDSIFFSKRKKCNVSDCSPIPVWCNCRDERLEYESLLNDNVLTFVFICYVPYSTCPRVSDQGNIPVDLDLEHLSLDLYNMLINGHLSDVQLQCTERAIPAHRNILSARSQVFKAMLDSDMLENRSGNISIIDIEVPILEQLLEYIYSGKLSKFTPDTIHGLYTAADKYAIDQLKESCRDIIIDHMTLENACDYLVLADTHSDKKLKDAVIHFILRRGIPLKEDVWPEFCEAHSKLAMEVLNKAYIEKYASTEEQR